MAHTNLFDAIDSFLAPQGRKVRRLTSFAVVPNVDTGSRNKVMVCVEFDAPDPVPKFVGERELREAEERGYQRGVREIAMLFSERPCQGQKTAAMRAAQIALSDKAQAVIPLTKWWEQWLR